jgi:HAD superfamily hydrolase (TIGR01509 family)
MQQRFWELRPKVVLFDMDGTLFDTERLYRDAMYAAGIRQGVTVDEHLFVQLVGRGWSESRRILEDALGSGFDVDAFAGETDRIAMEWISAGGIPRKSGVPQVLEVAKGRGLRMAVVTSTRNPRAERKLNEAGIRSYFECVVTGDRVERGKPEPDIYLLALELMGVPASEAIAVEDSPNGLRAAVSAGLPTLIVPDLVPITDELNRLAAARLSSLEELAAWLESW